MKNIEILIIAVIAAFAFVGCCHTHHRHTVIRTGYYERPRYEVVRPRRQHLPLPRHHKKRR